MNKPLTSNQKLAVISLQLKQAQLRSKAQDIKSKAEKEIHQIELQLTAIGQVLNMTLSTVAKENDINPATHTLDADLNVIEKPQPQSQAQQA